MDLRSLQKPLKEQYRSDPNASQIRIRAKGGQTDVPVACSVDIGRAIFHAEAHKGVGGAGTAASDSLVGFGMVDGTPDVDRAGHRNIRLPTFRPDFDLGSEERRAGKEGRFRWSPIQ